MGFQKAWGLAIIGFVLNLTRTLYQSGCTTSKAGKETLSSAAFTYKQKQQTARTEISVFPFVH